jgi:hypothetical protein
MTKMKNLLLTLSLLFTVMACKNSTTKQQDYADIKQQNSLSTPKTESKDSSQNSKIDANAPLDKVTSILDYYKAFEKEKSNKDKELGLQGSGLEIVEKDEANGYLKFKEKGEMGYKEMGYFTYKDVHFIALASFGCGPACTMYKFEFFELRGGKLVDKTQQYYDKKEGIAMSTKDFVESHRVLFEQNQQATINPEVKLDLEMEIPKKGIEIKVYGTPAKIGIGKREFLGSLKYLENEKTFQFDGAFHPSQI